MKIIRHHFNIIDSTNTWGKQHCHEFPKDKITLITASEQTAGRGRFKRRWESPAVGNIYATFCFFIDKSEERRDLGNIPQILAISIITILQKLDFQAKLKWPNDILLSNKKVGGILAETISFPNDVCMIIGIGLNVNMSDSLLQKIDRPATSLMVESQRVFDVEEVLNSLKDEFNDNLELFLKQGFPLFLESYRQHSYSNLHQMIRFNDNQRIWQGLFHKINEDGSLALKLDNGQIKTFVAGEILWPGE